MTDLTSTLGAFVEIAAVNDTVVTRGPSGRIARVDLLLLFERGKATASLSLHWDEARWKLMGISVELPKDMIAQETSQNARKARVTEPAILAAVTAAAKAVVARLATGDATGVWADAAPGFQASVTQADFAQLEADRRAVVGKVVQYLDTTSASHSPGKTGATVVALVEYAGAAAVATRFGFERPAGTEAWRLTSYKVVLPMPLADAAARPGAAPPP